MSDCKGVECLHGVQNRSEGETPTTREPRNMLTFFFCTHLQNHQKFTLCCSISTVLREPFYTKEIVWDFLRRSFLDSVWMSSFCLFSGNSFMELGKETNRFLNCRWLLIECTATLSFENDWLKVFNHFTWKVVNESILQTIP